MQVDPRIAPGTSHLVRAEFYAREAAKFARNLNTAAIGSSLAAVAAAHAQIAAAKSLHAIEKTFAEDPDQAKQEPAEKPGKAAKKS